MSESTSIQDLLASYFSSREPPEEFDPQDAVVHGYVNHLTALSISNLSSTEPALLDQSASSTRRAIQTLSRKSHQSVIATAESLAPLAHHLPCLTQAASQVQDALPQLESKAAGFAEKYRRANESTSRVLVQRRNALLLATNVDRLASILDLPTLISSTISASAFSAPFIASAPSNSNSPTLNYASALQLHAHVKRLLALYPSSSIVQSINRQTEGEVRLLTTNLITTLRSQSLKLAVAMRTIGWLRRVAPELDPQLHPPQSAASSTWPVKTSTTSAGNSADGPLGAIFLACRLASLHTMLEALDPLKELADDESAQRLAAVQAVTDSEQTVKLHRNQSRPISTRQTADVSLGTQTERYLKRYIEIFREQTFSIVSMYKNIFPAALPKPAAPIYPHIPRPHATRPRDDQSNSQADHVSLVLASPLATFPAHLVDCLFSTLRTYLPNVHDSSSRQSLLTQVLYCAGSLGRLGGDFSMMIALLEEDIGDISIACEHEQVPDMAQVHEQDQKRHEREQEWAGVMKKYRVQASRLELLANGVGNRLQTAKKGLAAS